MSDAPEKQISSEETFDVDIRDHKEMQERLAQLADRTTARLLGGQAFGHAGATAADALASKGTPLAQSLDQIARDEQDGDPEQREDEAQRGVHRVARRDDAQRREYQQRGDQDGAGPRLGGGAPDFGGVALPEHQRREGHRQPGPLIVQLECSAQPPYRDQHPQ